MGVQGSSHCHVDQMCGDWKSKSQCLSVKCSYIDYLRKNVHGTGPIN